MISINNYLVYEQHQKNQNTKILKNSTSAVRLIQSGLSAGTMFYNRQYGVIIGGIRMTYFTSVSLSLSWLVIYLPCFSVLHFCCWSNLRFDWACVWTSWNQISTPSPHGLIEFSAGSAPTLLSGSAKTAHHPSRFSLEFELVVGLN